MSDQSDLTTALTFADTLLGLIAAGTMTALRAREIFGEYNARLQAAHAEGRTMTQEELQAWLAEGDQVVLEEMQRVRDARARVEQLPE